MSRLDWLLIKRFAGRIGLVLTIAFGLLIMVETFNTIRFSQLANTSGVGTALAAVVASAARWTVKILTIIVLLGSILALLELQRRREFVAAKAAGASVWRLARGPLAAVFLLGVAVSVGLDGPITAVNRAISPLPPGSSSAFSGSQIWLTQYDPQGREYILHARGVLADRTTLTGINAFMTGAGLGVRYTANQARLEDGYWLLAGAKELLTDAAATDRPDLRLPTSETAADLGLKLSAIEDFTFAELAAALAGPLADDKTRAQAATRLGRLLSLPLILCGAALIAFAFTASYRRTDKYGAAVLGGIVLGFVVFVATEMADRAGSAGVMDPAFAAWGPAVIAIVIGVTVLLYKEDGRA